MKNLNTQEMIQQAKEEIMKFAPRNSHVTIDVREEQAGIFSTHIFLHLKNNTLVAKKEDMYLLRSFQKAIRALKSQFYKKKIHYHEAVRLEKIHAA